MQRFIRQTIEVATLTALLLAGPILVGCAAAHDIGLWGL